MRLAAQQVAGKTFKKPSDLVRHMTAMQAQDPSMIKWAVGCRIPGITEKAVDEALVNGTILRTHLLRPTWHLVAAEDIHWLLELTAPQIRTIAKGRTNELGLSPEVLKKSNAIIEKLLSDGQSHARDELQKALEAQSITNTENRLSYILFHAELDGLICSGAVSGNKQTYRLLESCVKRPKSLSREEALHQLALRYYTSHGPATQADFTWWSGLSIKDTRTGMEAIKDKLHSETVDGETYWFDSKVVKDVPKQQVLLLPAFDEYIISYRDRSAALEKAHHSRAVSTNGIFRPVVVIDGKVRGLWKRSVKKDQVLIETELFGKLTAAERKGLEEAAGHFGQFLGKTAVVL